MQQQVLGHKKKTVISDNSDLNGTREAELEKVYGVKTYDGRFKGWII